MMDEWIDGLMDGLFVLMHYIPDLYMGRDTRKPVFRVSDKARLKPDSSAKETSYKIEILPMANLDMKLSKKRITKALIRLRRCAG